MDDCVVIDKPITGSISPSGLKIGGLITEVLLNAATWTALPASPLLERNALSLQNYSGVEIKVNYSPAVPGYIGMVVPTGGERQYDISDGIILYAKASAGAPTVTVEEIA